MKNTWMASFEEFRACVKRIDFDRLPGLDAQLLMAPPLRHREIRSLGVGSNAWRSSILFLFYPDEQGQPNTVFIQRPVYDGVHSGQISFPGGRYEDTDSDLMHTALREAREEIGIDVAQVEVIGKLTDLYIPPSNFLVCPFLAVAERRPVFRCDPSEVAAIIEIGLPALFLNENRKVATIQLDLVHHVQVPCFTINGHTIWGATAMIISELLQVLQGIDQGRNADVYQ
jgi:8-oxo-dGTP pyrophosphatase MutT (NUDIX family)